MDRIDPNIMNTRVKGLQRWKPQCIGFPNPPIIKTARWFHIKIRVKLFRLK